MKKSLSNTALLISILLLFIQLSSCEKIGEFLPGHGGNSDNKLCNIRKITTRFQDLQTGLPDSFVYSFSYNSKGNPVNILTNKQLGTSLYNMHFRYDKRHRLTTFYGEFNIPGVPLDFFDLHKYGYDSKNRISKDTFYFSGGSFSDVENGTKTPIAFYFYEYDHKDRIIKVRTINYPDTEFEYEWIDNFQYDGNGNLIVPGRVYDNTINMARTNSIWMFLRRDYSVNNSNAIERVNRFGLPILLNWPISPYTNFLPAIYLSNSSIAYECN